MVDCNGSVVVPYLLRESNAEDEAALLNREGLPEFRPYRVETFTIELP